MKRLKGPELKMPNVKVPPVLADVYWDLRDRRLLPLVALVVVAIAALPFLLGGGSEEAVPPPSDAGASLPEVAEAASLTVVEANPGLRDYRKRLAARTATDPFKQRYTQVNLAGAQLNPQTEGSEGSSSDTGTVTTTSGESGGETGSSGAESKPSPTESSPSPGGSSPDKGDDGTSGELTLFSFAAKVRIAKSGGKDPVEKEEPVVKERVLPLTELPGEKTPVVTYMGSSKKGEALLMVSPDVKSVFGEAKCISGDDACQLLEAEPGFPVVFVYGGNEVRYTINVLKIFPVATSHSSAK